MTRIVAMGVFCVAACFMGLAHAGCLNNACTNIYAWFDGTGATNKCYSYNTYVQGGRTFKKLGCEFCPGDSTNKYCDTTANTNTCELNVFQTAKRWEYDWKTCAVSCTNVPLGNIIEATPGTTVISTTDDLLSLCQAGS